jgi:hypothetical protein
MELAAVPRPTWDHAAFLAATQTPVFFGSAVNNFGVMEVLDALVDLAPSPQPRTSTTLVQPPAGGQGRSSRTTRLLRRGVQGAGQHGRQPPRPHRLRAHGLGKYTPGMKLKVQRTAKELRPTSVVTFLSQRREAVDEAYAGDIIGFTTHGGVQLGDTITDGANLQFTGLPFFAPELFMTVMLKNPLRTKQLQQGLAQLGEEGAIQVFRPEIGGPMLLGAVGQLQFEVVQHRLKTEYDCDVRWKAAPTPARAGSRPTRRPSCRPSPTPTRSGMALDAAERSPSSALALRRAAGAGALPQDPLPPAARARRTGAAPGGLTHRCTHSGNNRPMQFNPRPGDLTSCARWPRRSWPQRCCCPAAAAAGAATARHAGLGVPASASLANMCTLEGRRSSSAATWTRSTSGTTRSPTWIRPPTPACPRTFERAAGAHAGFERPAEGPLQRRVPVSVADAQMSGPFGQPQQADRADAACCIARDHQSVPLTKVVTTPGAAASRLHPVPRP